MSDHKTVYEKVKLTADDLKHHIDLFPCRHFDTNTDTCVNQESLAYNDRCKMLHCQFMCKWFGQKQVVD